MESYAQNKLARAQSKGLSLHDDPIHDIYRFGPQPTIIQPPSSSFGAHASYPISSAPPPPTVEENDRHGDILGNLSLSEVLGLEEKIRRSSIVTSLHKFKHGHSSSSHDDGDDDNDANNSEKRNGFVDIRTPDGSWFRGNMVGGVKQGHGVLHDASGLQYDGNWFGNQRHGFGIMRYPNGDSYEGSWIYDKKDGPGVYTWASGEVYNGLYSNNQRQGRGEMLYANGDRYIGLWQYDAKHGPGDFYEVGGPKSKARHWCGVWQKDEISKATLVGSCGVGGCGGCL